MKLLCRDPEHPRCKTPVAEIEGGELVIVVRHHGERHESRFSLRVLIERLKEEHNEPD